jgi:hypothetical protein
VHRHGKAIAVTKVKRVVLLPHVVDEPKLRVAYGKRATVSGLLLLRSHERITADGCGWIV